MSRRTIFVLGMGRSGTSTVAGILKHLGVEWGPDDLMMAAQPDNPLGFWEFNPLHDINFEIMRRLGGDWHNPPQLAVGWELSPALDDLRTKAAQTIATYFSSSLWGFKDPRCCQTLPFWKTVIPNPIDCVIPIRNPVEVAASLLRRDTTPMSKGVALWASYVAWAWKASRGLRHHYVTYDGILNNPQMEVKRLSEFAGLPPVREAFTAALSSIRSDLCHQRASQRQLFWYRDVPSNVKAAYLALVTAASSQSLGRLFDEDVLDHCIRSL